MDRCRPLGPSLSTSEDGRKFVRKPRGSLHSIERRGSSGLRHDRQSPISSFGWLSKRNHELQLTHSSIQNGSPKGGDIGVTCNPGGRVKRNPGSAPVKPTHTCSRLSFTITEPGANS